MCTKLANWLQTPRHDSHSTKYGSSTGVGRNTGSFHLQNISKRADFTAELAKRIKNSEPNFLASAVTVIFFFTKSYPQFKPSGRCKGWQLSQRCHIREERIHGYPKKKSFIQFNSNFKLLMHFYTLVHYTNILLSKRKKALINRFVARHF